MLISLSIYKPIITARQRSCREVMFSVASVHHSVQTRLGGLSYVTITPPPQTWTAHCTDPPPTLDMGPRLDRDPPAPASDIWRLVAVEYLFY